MTVWPSDLWERMVRAVAAVRERLLRSTGAPDNAQIAYAVVGGNAVGYWVGTRDEGAIRNTPNVDTLIAAGSREVARSALERVGFVFRAGAGIPVTFLDGPDGKERSAVRLWFSGDQLPRAYEPLPSLEGSLPTESYCVVSLSSLVRMKLSAFRTIDKVHLHDLIGVGLIDATWPARFPEVLAERLRQILANPDG